MVIKGSAKFSKDPPGMMELFHPKDKRGKSLKSYRLGMSGSQTENAVVDDDKKKRRSSTKKNKSNKSNSLTDVAAD
jgi:hypothetical protein